MRAVHKILILLFTTYAIFLCFLTFQRGAVTEQDQEASQFLYTDTRRQSPEEPNSFLAFDEFSDDPSDESTDESSDDDDSAQLQDLWTGHRGQKSAGRPKARSRSKSRMPKLPMPAKKAMDLRALLNLLGAYPEMKLANVRDRRYKKKFKVERDNNYCVRVDDYNMKNPDNMFKNKIYYTDYANTGFVANTLSNETKVIMNQIGLNTYVHINYKPAYLHPAVTRYFISLANFASYYRVGREFLCVTQMSNHIPGQLALVAKDLVVDQANLYLHKYRDRPQSFNKSSLFPVSYRLQNQTECREFFSIINSDQYKESLKDEPIQYMTKVGRGSHQGRGVIVLDDVETLKLNEDYQYGSRCGEMSKLLIAQAYISNPLLVNKVNKFDFRIYMLIASTNPLIVYYHDGFLRISLSTYDKASSDKSVHLTNTHISDAVKKKQNDTSGNDDQNWMSFEAFQTYLLEEGVISDPNWLENDLKPSFYKALTHLVRMAKHQFWNQSNVYALHGVDFMLDDKMNLWFIESNPSPQMGGGSPVKNKIYESVFKDHLEITNKYYMSRMKRLTSLMKEIEDEDKGSLLKNIDKWRKEYQAAMKNRLEPEYEISKENSFKLIMDQNLPGEQAYFGNLPSECL